MTTENSFKQFNQPIISRHLLLLLLLILIITQVIPFSNCCHDDERNALLTFKSHLIDPSDRLSSWKGENCCNWNGIHCSNDSFHVVKVDLQNYASSMDSLNGAISPSLFNLSHLQYLDLSYNNFSSSKIPYQLAYLKNLTHLDISHSMFSGPIPTQFANLSSLSYLDVSCSDDDSSCSVSSIDASWLRGLANLEELRLNGVDLNSPIPIQLSNLTSLSLLDFTNCQLQAGSLLYLPPQLKEIHVTDNPNLDINLSLISNASLLNSLYASYCSIQGSLSSITNLSQLENLNLNGNNITGQIPSSMSNLKNLMFLTLSGNILQGSIPESICEISSLVELRLEANNLTETIPSCIWKLGNLTAIDVRKNSIEGTVSLISLINTSNLTDIWLSSNRITLEISHQLNPPLPSYKLEQLRYLELASCNIKGYIPGYFCNLTNLDTLGLDNNNITGTIPSCLSTLHNLQVLDLSNNNLQGTIPHSLLFSNLTSLLLLDLSSNNLRGHLPLPPQGCTMYDLSKNNFTGGISIEFEDILSNMIYFSLSDNKLSGSIPSFICSNEAALEHLDLSNNQLHGTIPSNIQYCASLISLNLGYNNFSGSIPTFIGSLHNLKIISLRKNAFTGSIPKDITKLRELQILDLSINNLSGPIPLEIGNLEMLTSTPKNASLISGKFFTIYGNRLQLQMANKGRVEQVTRLYNYNSGIDFSCNNLEGNIPEDLGLLKGLAMLNLSHNCLSGKIPTRVGNMIGLQSLDLSFNKLSGEIPQSLESISGLGYFNLSFNNLSGRIPNGRHLETLGGENGSAYIGNYLLCGPPTNNICHVDASLQNDEDDEDENVTDKLLILAIIFLSFGVGFWGLFLVLLLKKEIWWTGYWKIIDKIAKKIADCIW